MALRDLISPKPYPISTPGAQPTAPAPVVAEDDVAPLKDSLSAGRTQLEQLRTDQTRMGGEAANLTLKIAADTANLVSYRNAQEVFNAQQKIAESQGLEKNIKKMLDDERSSPQYKEKERINKELAELGSFVPTEVTAPMLGVLFSAIGATGMLLGGNSKSHAKFAMAAMNGMAEGFGKGREQYNKEQKAAFDTNVKLLQTKLSAIKDGLEDARREAILNKEAADIKVRQTLASNEAQFLQKHTDQRGLESTIALVDGQLKNLNRAIQFQTSKATQLAGQLDAKEIQLAIRKMESARREAEARYREQVRAEDARQRHLDRMSEIRLTASLRPEKGGGTSGDKFGFGDIIATNLNEAVGTIANIVNLPHDVTGGIFQGRNTSGLLMAPLGVLAQELTDEDVQRYNKEIKNFGKFASRVVSGGRVVPASVQKDFEDQFVINKGDSPLAVLTSLAQMRQTLERATEVKLRSSSTDPGLKTLYQDGLNVIRNSIPFTVNDVNTFANQTNNKKTFSQWFQEYGFRSPSAATGTGQSTPSAPTSSQPKTPAIPSGVPSTAQYSPSQKSWWWQENNQWKSKKVD